MNKRIHSLKVKSVIALLISAVISIAFFAGLHFTCRSFLNSYFESPDYVSKETKKYADKLQDYVTNNQLTPENIDELDEWARKQKIVYFSIYRGEDWLYDSSYVNADNASMDGLDVYYGGKYYNISFADGEAQIYLIGLFEYKFYNYVTVGEILASIILFMVIFSIFVQRKINDILRMEKEIKILESGGLDCEITIKGNDELSSLAEGLNQMRISLSENMKREEELVQANNDLVTGMAHDFRTPLTTLMLYLELLENNKYKNDEELKKYLQKSSAKAKQLKGISDQLFERFLLAKEKSIVLEPPQKVQYALGDILSDMVTFLEAQGFQVERNMNWPFVKIEVSMDYVSRIIDNISSNIIKYADASQPVRMSVGMHEKYVFLRFENTILKNQEKVNSTNIGVPNIKLMMEKMQGYCEVCKTEDSYICTLVFASVLQG